MRPEARPGRGGPRAAVMLLCPLNCHPFLFTLYICFLFLSHCSLGTGAKYCCPGGSQAHFPVCTTKSLRVPLESSVRTPSSQLRVKGSQCTEVVVGSGFRGGGLWLGITLRWAFPTSRIQYLTIGSGDVIILEIKCTINVMCFNYHETTLLSGPWKNCVPRK